MILSEDKAQFDWALTSISPISAKRSLTDSGCCQQSTMGNEICIPFSAFAFSCILHPYVPHCPAFTSITTPSILSSRNVRLSSACVRSDLGVTLSGCVRFCQQVCTWIKEAQNLGGGPPYWHTGGEPQRRVTVKSAPSRNALWQASRLSLSARLTYAYERKWSRKGKCVTHIWLWMLFLLLLLNTQSCSSPCVC